MPKITKLVTVEEMQTIEKEANACGLTYDFMMENAGHGLALVVVDKFAHLQEDGILGLVGSGNNGGDTLVALTYLAQAGWRASACLVRPRPANDLLIERLIQAGGKIYRYVNSADYEILSTLLTTHKILLDGILGTGFRLPLKNELAEIIGYVRKFLLSDKPGPIVIAVDCPSGVDCDSGQAAPECCPADLTVTMAAIKQGLFKFPAYHLVGELRVVDIGLPEDGEGLVSWREMRCFVPDAIWIKETLPDRPADAHKGTFGTALIVAGSSNYSGAVLLAGEAAYRIGAGLVTLAVPEPLHAALAGHLPEATWLLLPHDLGVIDVKAAEVIIENVGRATAVLIGPGFGLEDTTGDFLTQLISVETRSGRSKIGFMPPSKPGQGELKLPPAVIDADGLRLLARIPEWASRLPSLTVLTPHPGEMSVLTNLSKEDIQQNRIHAAQQFSRVWGHVVVLKGAFTIVAAPDGQTAVIPVATPALARAGTGDVLAGLIVGLRAQGVPAFQAAVAGAWIHAYAGVRAASRLGNSASVLAGDVLHHVPEVMREL